MLDLYELLTQALKQGRASVAQYTAPPEARISISFLAHYSEKNLMSKADPDKQLMRFHQAVFLYQEVLNTLDNLIDLQNETGMDYIHYLKVKILNELLAFVSRAICSGHLKEKACLQHIYGERTLKDLYEAEAITLLLYARYKDPRSGIYSAKLSIILQGFQESIISILQVIKEYLIDIRNIPAQEIDSNIKCRKIELEMYQKNQDNLFCHAVDHVLDNVLFFQNNVRFNIT